MRSDHNKTGNITGGQLVVVFSLNLAHPSYTSCNYTCIVPATPRSHYRGYFWWSLSIGIDRQAGREGESRFSLKVFGWL